MTQDEMKKAAGQEALKFVEEGKILGVGTGSTVDKFIDALAAAKLDIPACVSSSVRSTERLESYGFNVIDLNEAGEISTYIDGADEIEPGFSMIKGGGGALTREKIIAACAGRYVCIADESKLVSKLGAFPLPVEVIPMAVSYVSRELEKLGGRPVLRKFITDNGNNILDVHGLNIEDPKALEAQINQITGVVTVGLFAKRGANVLLMATPAGVRTITRE